MQVERGFSSFLRNWEKSSKKAKLWQKMKKSLAQLVFNPFLAFISGQKTRFQRLGPSLLSSSVLLYYVVLHIGIKEGGITKRQFVFNSDFWCMYVILLIVTILIHFNFSRNTGFFLNKPKKQVLGHDHEPSI